MAKNKKSFVLYVDLIHTVKKMSKTKAGELFLTILEYVNDNNPEINDTIIDLVFEPIKQQLKRDLVKYDKKVVLWSEAGKASAKARKEKSTDVNGRSKRSTDSTVSVNDSVNVNVKEIILYLNSNTNKNFKYTTQKTKAIINSRFNEGFKIEDFKKVIDNKIKDWLNDEKWNRFLRPETLFGTKFESYLNESVKVPTKLKLSI